METLKVKKLRCEYKENPLGIDVKKPRLSWQIDSPKRGTMQRAYALHVATDSSFENIIWDTGCVESEQSVHVEYMGPALKPRTRYYYRVKVWDQAGHSSDWSETAYWETGLLCSDNWIAEWIVPHDKFSESEASPMLRRAFHLDGKIAAARVYVSSLGLYELYINGKRVGDWLLTPGWTSYNKRLQYQTYDVTDYLIEGNNAIGAILGNGWYKGELGWQDHRNLYGDRTALILQMHVLYDDGREEIITTDTNWKSSTGPILMSEIYHGEIYDARLEKDGWSTSDYDDHDWLEVSLYHYPKDILVAQENVPVRRIEEIKPIKLFVTPAGEKVIDFGQNMVGWVKFSVSGMSGSKVILKHAEVLDKNGNFYTENLRRAKQTIQYILKGSGNEVFEPHFTFQGFRYVKIESFPGEPLIDQFTGIVIHSDMEQTGYFECSNELVNKLQHNIIWGQKGNFVDVPTDCPQRDERLGWTGDAQVFIRTACFNMNVAPFFSKWLKDLKADQLESGGVPYVIPNVLGSNSHSSAAWGDAAVICPWTIYLCYGDKRILEEQYESMKAWVEYIRKQGDNEYLWNTGFHYGDWLALDAKENSYTGATAKDFIATAFYAYSTGLLKKTAEVLHKEDDARRYGELHKKIIENFQKEFVTPNGRLAVPTQTAHVLVLMFDLIEDKHRERIVKTLVQYLKENNDHLTTGFVGTPYLCHVLSQNGYTELAYKLLMQQDFPSWLYQVKKGATTIWEHWDGIKEDGSFWSKDMNSFNHYAYGSIGDWLYRVVAGLDTSNEKAGYKEILIHPHPDKSLKYAKAGFESMYGKISSSWKEENDAMEISVSIPPNTKAVVILPFARVDDVYENGIEIRKVDGVYFYQQLEHGVKLEVGSGSYTFSYKKSEKRLSS